MNKYIRMHIVEAEPMSRVAYNEKRGWKVPSNENPNDEGYYLKRDDGYLTWCTKEQFKSDFRPIEGMTFGMAVEALKRGKRVARKGWNGKGMWIELQVPDAHSKMQMPYVYIKNAQDKKVPWVPCQADILGEDWMGVE